MKYLRVLAIWMALSLMSVCLFGCYARDDEQNGDKYEVLTGYIVSTDEGVRFFVATEDGVLLKQNDFLRLKTGKDDDSLASYHSGDIVRIKLLTVEESYPMQARIYGIELMEKRWEGIPGAVYDTIRGFGYSPIALSTPTAIS